ncbi:RIP metalloprotease RseP [Paenibacillus albiflavus]|uniref:Zinc metalloprotease n=1 Tax=Paenibacillus albiflavus TaxID=2545760 RepID=A0A4R4EJU2_9BACL|nr:RIP metalloprotease RseP [Paenibacillus albiflavus]TCZ79997.1 RIP metalloprotease RseP [Paenibacillus albiflavus]
MSSIELALKVILLFFVLVTIHEFGHFYFAKRAGILVREFAIGFGPKLFSHKKGETRYTLRLLPIGGFVRMAGEDPEQIEIKPGQTIVVKLNKEEQVSYLYMDQLDQRPSVIQGEVTEIDLTHDLQMTMNVDGEMVTFSVHPQAMMVARGTETQIAPYDRQFGSKSVGKRALSIVMGPVMNFLLAVVLFCVVVIMQGIPANIKLDQVNASTPAQVAGLQAGDVITHVNGLQVGADTTSLKQMIQQSADKPMDWTVERGGQTLDLKVTPKLDKQQGSVLIGVVLGSDKRSATAGEVLEGTWNNITSWTVNILDGFKKLVFGEVKMDDLGGPVRIVQMTSEFASHGLSYYLLWTAIFSLYLGLFNLLPFPALDGSRLVFLGIEAVRGKPIDPSRESLVHFVGFALMMLLMVVVTYNDIVRLFTS